MALVDALAPYLMEEERRKQELAAQQDAPLTAEFARSLIGRAPKPPVKPQDPSLPAPEPIAAEPPTLRPSASNRDPNYEVPDPIAALSGIRNPSEPRAPDARVDTIENTGVFGGLPTGELQGGPLGPTRDPYNPTPNLQMPDLSTAAQGQITGGHTDPYDQYMVEHQRLHGAQEHKGFGNRFKHALQGMGVGALASIGDAWKNSGGKGTFADLLGAGAGGAAGGGAAAIYKPSSADTLYNKLFVEPEAQRTAEKARIARAEDIGFRKAEMDIQQGQMDIEKTKAEIAKMPASEARAQLLADLQTKQYELDVKKHDLDVQKQADAGKEWDTYWGGFANKKDNTFTEILGERRPGTSSDRLAPGGAGMAALRKQAEDEIRTEPGGDVEQTAIDSADIKNDPSGIQRKFEQIFRSPELGRQKYEEWIASQSTTEMKPPPDSASPEEKKKYQEYLARPNDPQSEANRRSAHTELSKYYEQARQELLAEKRRGAQLEFDRKVQARIQQYLAKTGGGTPPAKGPTRRTKDLGPDGRPLSGSAHHDLE